MLLKMCRCCLNTSSHTTVSIKYSLKLGKLRCKPEKCLNKDEVKDQQSSDGIVLMWYNEPDWTKCSNRTQRFKLQVASCIPRCNPTIVWCLAELPHLLIKP